MERSGRSARAGRSSGSCPPWAASRPPGALTVRGLHREAGGQLHRAAGLRKGCRSRRVVPPEERRREGNRNREDSQPSGLDRQ